MLAIPPFLLPTADGMQQVTGLISTTNFPKRKQPTNMFVNRLFVYEREMSLELTTCSLGSCRSTN